MITPPESTYEPLNETEINELFLKCKKGDKKARERLILHNLRFVIYIAKNFKYAEIDELKSIGTIGLIKAIDSFNLDKNTKFSTYSLRCIENEIKLYLRKNKKLDNNISIHTILNQDNNGNIFTLEDTLMDTHLTAEEIMVTNSETELLHKIIETLPKRSKKIIQLYFGFEDDTLYNQEEIANLFGISQSYVSKVIRTTVEKIKIKYKKNI